MTKIYVASSRRNNTQPLVVKKLRESGYEVYDFKNPEPSNHGFHWSEIDINWKNWTPEKFKEALKHPIAVDGFNRDMQSLFDCDVCVMVMPCGRSAHLEAGFALGAGKHLIIMLTDGEPELMYNMTPHICVDIKGIRACLEKIEGELIK